MSQTCCFFSPSLSFQLFMTLLLLLSQAFHPHLRTVLQPHFMLLRLPSFLLSGISASLGYPATPVLTRAFPSRNSDSVHTWLHTPIVLEGFFLRLFFPFIFPNNSSDYLFTSKKPMSFGFPGSISKKMDSFCNTYAQNSNNNKSLLLRLFICHSLISSLVEAEKWS